MKDRPWSLAACLALSVVYLVLAARTILGGDNAELVTVAVDGGVAHPPGYPLYISWLRALSFLPGESAAHKASLATALSGAMTLVLLGRASRAWGASESGAALAVTIFGATGLAMKLATQAEVFMLNAALVAGVLLVAAPEGPLRGGKRAMTLGLLAGLALSNHHSAVLVAPVGIWGAWTGIKEARKTAVTAALAFGALLVGLTPYALLVVDARRAAPSMLVWGDTGNVGGLWRHFVRSDFGTTVLGRGTPAPLANVLFLVRNLGRQTHLLPLVMSVFGAVAVAGKSSKTRRAGWMLVGSALLVGPVFVARFNVPLAGLGAVVVERFHLLPLLFVALLAGVGMTPYLARLPRLRLMAPLAITVVLGASVTLAWPDVRLDHRTTVEDYIHDTLAMAPPNAIFLGTGDHRTFGIAYAQRVRRERPDVDYVDARVLTFGWYDRRVRSRLGLELANDDGTVDNRVVATRLLGTGRPLLLTDTDLKDVARAFPVYPYGTGLRVLPKGETVPPVADVERDNIALFKTFHTSPPCREGSWAFVARNDYARTWLMIADLYERHGMLVDAQRNRARAAPWLATKRD